VYPAGYSPENTAASSESGHGVTVTPSLLGVGDSPGYGTFTVTLSSPPAHRVDSVEVVGISTNRTALYNVGPYYYTGAGSPGSGFYGAAGEARRLLSYLYEDGPRWVRSEDADEWESQTWMADYGEAPLPLTPVPCDPEYSLGGVTEMLSGVLPEFWWDKDGWLRDVFLLLGPNTTVQAGEFSPADPSVMTFGWATEDSLFLPSDGLWCSAFGPEEYGLDANGDVYGFRTNRGVFAGSSYVYSPHVRDMFGASLYGGSDFVASDPRIYTRGSKWLASGFAATNLYQWDRFESLSTNSAGARMVKRKRYPGTNAASDVRGLLSGLNCSYRVTEVANSFRDGGIGLPGYTVVKTRERGSPGWPDTWSVSTNQAAYAYYEASGAFKRYNYTCCPTFTDHLYYDPPFEYEPISHEPSDGVCPLVTSYIWGYDRFETAIMPDYVLDWPSKYAVESGYVSRVRVYGIFKQYEWNGAVAMGTSGSHSSDLSYDWSVGGTSYAYTYERDIDFSWSYSSSGPLVSVLYGVTATNAAYTFPGNFRLSYEVQPTGVSYDPAARLHGNAGWPSPPPALMLEAVRPVLLDGDVPLVWPLKVDLKGADSARDPLGWTPFSDHTITLNGSQTYVFEEITGNVYEGDPNMEPLYATIGYRDGNWTGTATGTYYEYEVRLVLDKIITVVDWNWKHLSDSAAAEPGFVPEWVVSNTNSPLAP